MTAPSDAPADAALRPGSKLKQGITGPMLFLLLVVGVALFLIARLVERRRRDS